MSPIANEDATNLALLKRQLQALGTEFFVPTLNMQETTRQIEVMLERSGSNHSWQTEYAITDGRLFSASRGRRISNLVTITGGTYVIVIRQGAHYDQETLQGHRPSVPIVTKIFIRPGFDPVTVMQAIEASVRV